MRPFATHASWAVWGPLDRDPAEPFTRASDIGFPEVRDADLEPLLTRRAVFVGLNPGNGFAPDRGPWANWHHGPRSNDHLIAEALRGTPLWGSYMTDLVQTIESDSAVIAAALAVDPAVVHDGVLRLLDQLHRLGSDGRQVALVCFGALVHRSVLAHAGLLEDELGIEARHIHRVLHYSGSASAYHRGDPGRYRELVHQTLAPTGLLSDGVPG
jgi:hypothetical protein